MNSDRVSDIDESSLRELVIRDFVVAWKAGRSPRIEDILAAHHELPRESLLQELILEEIDLPAERPPSEDEFLIRFPDDHHVVREAFE